MIRGIYAKIFLWFCFAMILTGLLVLSATLLIHGQSLGSRWMTGVLNQYARVAVDTYSYNGKKRLAEFLQRLEESSRIKATLLDPDGLDVTAHGIPPGTEVVMAEAHAAGESRFQTGRHWRGASLVDGPDGRYTFVASMDRYTGSWTWENLRTPTIRLAVVLLSGGLLCGVLARHLAAPIRTLQTLAGRIADGDLSVRALPSIASRKDELSDLAQDFDRMADRIQGLLRKQQEILGDISHELRSPLTRLSVSLELVRRGERDAVDRMQADLDRLDAMIGQILTLTRLQVRGNQKNETTLNLRSILESVADDACFEGQEDQKSVVIGHADECWVKGDAALLRSCIENVIRNALHYTRPGTDVVVSLVAVEATDGTLGARFLAVDHGEGVPQEALHRLFEPFFRVSESREHQTCGTGLGLSIAQRIVHLHGGSILARNREQGGLEMEIRLPAEKPLPST